MFEDIERDLQYLSDHLDTIDDPSSPIASVFVAYALIIIHARFESIVRQSIEERCHGEDSAVNSYLSSSVRHTVRSVKVSDLSGLLGKFGSEPKRQFKQYNSSHPEEIQFYDNLEAYRHNVAHSGQSKFVNATMTVNATMSEVLEWFAAAKNVIVEFRKALGLDRELHR